MVGMGVLVSMEVVSPWFRSLPGRSNSIERHYRLGRPGVSKSLYYVIQEA